MFDRDALMRVCSGVDVHVVVQPLIRLSDSSVAGYEALGRVESDPSHGPLWWLEAADEAGLRVELELAFLRAAAALGMPPGGVPLFVNASLATLMDHRFEPVRATLPAHVLELSEHDRVDDYSALVAKVNEWGARGTPIAIDDVGAGYANMSHVLELNPAYIKVDRYLIAGIDKDPRRRAAVQSLHALAQACEAKSVAEGVERPEELAVLRDLGVDFAQGYLLARPSPTWYSSESRSDEPEPWAAEVIADAKDAHGLADRVTASLAADPTLLPSVYLARGGSLRCVARYGQTLVIDGIEPGIGLTGTAYAQGAEVFVADVTGDPRYRQAVPGVVSEFAVPLHAGGALVGVLNVDALRTLRDTDLSRVRRLAELLSERLSAVGVGEEHDSVLLRLARVSQPVAMSHELRELARAGTRATLELSNFDTAAFWTAADAEPRLAHARGTDAPLFNSLPPESLVALGDLVSTVSSCYTGGHDERLASGPTAVLTSQGIQALALIPLRDGRRMTGFLLASRRTGGPLIPGEIIQAAELLCLQIGSRMAALQRVVDLELRAASDPLTNVANRSRLDTLLEDPIAAAPFAGGWLAAVDLDRFKTVNDFYGHAAGDDVLREVAKALQGGPDGSTVIRIGGDEFVILLPPSSEGNAVTTCEQLQRDARELLIPYGADLSIGLSRIINEHGVRAALTQADAALYRCKHLGRGGVVLWSATVSSPPPNPANPEPLDGSSLERPVTRSRRT